MVKKWVVMIVLAISLVLGCVFESKYIHKSFSGLINSLETLQIELLVEEISTDIILEFKRQGITKATCNYLESHAYSLNEQIANPEIRNMHILL